MIILPLSDPVFEFIADINLNSNPNVEYRLLSGSSSIVALKDKSKKDIQINFADQSPGYSVYLRFALSGGFQFDPGSVSIKRTGSKKVNWISSLSVEGQWLYLKVSSRGTREKGISFKHSYSVIDKDGLSYDIDPFIEIQDN